MAALRPSTKKVPRNELTLQQRVELIDYHKKNPLAGSRKLAELFKCGRTQVQQILKKKESILEEYECNAPASRKRHRCTQFEEVNWAVSAWFSLARQRNVPISGPMLQEEALKIAEKLGCSEFKASNGWLESFKSRHNLKQLAVSGEAADVPEETVECWQERLKVILAGYKAEDIWNEDETGCFYRALPEKTLAEKKKECRGGKKSKERITVAFFVNSAGGKELPIVIGKYAKPRCFKGIRDASKPAGIPYFSNAKAWMNMDIMNSILSILNRRLKREKRNILLLLDNVSSHDPALKSKFSNIKVVFLPKNTTSKLQPLDAGIIKNFKVHYRRLLLQHTLSKVDATHLSASEIAKSIDILTAIRWVKQAWEKVSAQTIANCFRHCGAVEVAEELVVDPFADLEEGSEQDNESREAEEGMDEHEAPATDEPTLNDLVFHLNPTMTAEEYLSADYDLNTCYTFDSTQPEWQGELRALVCEAPLAKKSATTESDDEDDSTEPEQSKINNFDDAITASKDLALFLNENGMEELAENLTEVVSALEAAKINKKTVQTNLLKFFSVN